MDELPVFRAPKRRKVARPQSAERPSSAPPFVHDLNDGSKSGSQSSDEEGNAVQPQRRKPIKPSRLGVSFTSNALSRTEDDEALTIVPVDTTSDNLRHMTNRFVGTTGQVVDVDNHMMAYVESEMAKRHQTGVTSNDQNDDPASTSAQASSNIIGPSSFTTKEPQQQHQLAEVDLPPTAPPAPPPPKRTRKPRLGRDGKPLPPRRPKRRNSNDIARDALVEQVLHEHRLDHYQTQTPPPPPANLPTSGDPIPSAASQPNDPLTATDPATSSSTAALTTRADDEAFALRFQREFEEGLAERQAMQRKPQKRDKDQEKEKSHGPRLGGSRAARAKMHASMREAEKAKGGGGK